MDKAEKMFPVLKDLDLSDNDKDPRNVDLLIGADFYWSIVSGETRRCNDDGLTAINSKLGWILSGPFNQKEEEKALVSLCESVAFKVEMEFQEEEKNLEGMVQKFWQLENLGVYDEELSTYDKFKDSLKFINGRYEVSLPFKKNKIMIEDNYKLSKKGLINLRKKLRENKNLFQSYDDVIKEQLKSGVIERADNDPMIREVTYLPHRAVIRENKRTTKVRVVFDASAKNRGSSLNECLLKGPSLNPLMLDILLRFRAHNVGLVADIEKAYYKFR